MHSLRDHFVKFLSNIQPNVDRVELAQDIPGSLRDYLEETDKIITVSPHTRLSGSYSRYTAVNEIKDVDVLLFVREEYKDGEDCIREVINDLISALRGFPEYLKDESGKVNADLALKRQRRSVQVHLTLDGHEFNIDVVPSIAENGIEKPLLVPDRDLSKWVSSDPLGYSKYLSSLNQECLNKIIPLIKIFKHWRDVKMKRKRPKSYWLECLVVKHAQANRLNVKAASWGELVLSLLSSVYNDFYEKWKKSGEVPAIKDPMLGKDVANAKTWTRDEFETFMRRIEVSKRLAERAIEAQEENKAIKLWQDLFNDDIEYFPTVVEESFSKSLSGGSLFVSSSGEVLANPSKVERSWQSPEHRNYGDVSE